jgi:hypothetical protein
MKTPLFIFILLLLPGVLPAQTKEKKHQFSVYAGYANMIGGTAGLTKSTSSYENKLCSGFSWDAQYNYWAHKQIGIGVLYSGYSADGTHAQGSDHIYTHYIAPKLTVRVYQAGQFNLSFNGGAGYLFYLNDSRVFGKERRATGGHFGAHIGGTAEYKLGERWALSLETAFIYTKLSKINTLYHGENTSVHFSDNRLNVSRLNISAGLNFYF